MTLHGTDMSAPLPLTYGQAIGRAIELHAKGWSWQTIADVMREYHGLDRSSRTWRKALRGRVPSRARGSSFGSRGERCRT